MRNHTKTTRALGIFVILGLLMAGCSSSQDSGSSGTNEQPSPVAAGGDGDGEEAPFYAGKSIELIAPVGPGGTVDGVARLFANYLSEYIEGNPAVQVNNIEGGSGILAGNEFANSRDPNGETLMLVTQVSVLPAILGDSTVEYDLGNFEALWAANRGQSVIMPGENVALDEPGDIMDYEDPLIMGTIGAAGADLVAITGFEVLGLLNDKVEVIVGYESGDAIRNAFQAGELSFNHERSSGFIDEFVETHTALYTHGQIDNNGELIRDQVLPDRPNIAEAHEALHGEPPSGQAWDAFLMLMEVLARGGYSLQTHADAPQEARDALHDAIEKVLEDPEFDQALRDFMGPAPSSIAGEEAVTWGQGVANLDPELVGWVQSFLNQNFGLEFDS